MWGSDHPATGRATYGGITYPLKPRLSKSSYLEDLSRFVACRTRSGSSAFLANFAGFAIARSRVILLSIFAFHLFVISLVVCSFPRILLSFLSFQIRYADSVSSIVSSRCLPSFFFFFFLLPSSASCISTGSKRRRPPPSSVAMS